MRQHLPQPTFLVFRNSLFCLTALLLFSLLASCSSSSGRFHLEGQFKNLNQGEFYLYDLEHGTKDTIALSDGRFTFERSMSDTITLIMLFPNYSEIPIFARPGIKVTMKGDASHLRETDVKGSDDNEDMTAFRLHTADMTPPEAEQEAINFIKSHSASPVSNYLLRRYLLQTPTPDYQQAYQLCELLHQAQPTNIPLVRLHAQLEGLSHSTGKGTPLPSFSATDSEGNPVSNASLTADVNVIVAWAAWSYDSYSSLCQLHRLQKEHPGHIKVIMVSMDASVEEGTNSLERDSIDWPNVCDGLMWQSPLINQLGFSTIPANIVADKNGIIQGRNLNQTDMQQKVEEMLGV